MSSGGYSTYSGPSDPPRSGCRRDVDLHRVCTQDLAASVSPDQPLGLTFWLKEQTHRGEDDDRSFCRRGIDRKRLHSQQLLRAVEDLCKLESHPLFPIPSLPKKR